MKTTAKNAKTAPVKARAEENPEATPTLSTAPGGVERVADIIQQPMVAPAPKAGDKLTRGGTASGRPGQIVTAANRWRENYNPLRGLTMRRVVELLELSQRGDTAYCQWTYRKIERAYYLLSALITRCEAPLLGFDWEIKTKEDLPDGATPEMADAQAKALKEAYNRIDNLKAAVAHLHLAHFRGYAHLQKHRDADGQVYHLEPLHQWCVCRDGLDGNWFWNPDSRSSSAPLMFLGANFCIGRENLPLEDFIIVEEPRPIDEIALVNFVRANLAEKDWDGFVEIYAIPGGVVTMPPNVPQGKEHDYEEAAQRVAEGGSGAIPNGSSYKANDHPRGVDPFTPRLNRLDMELVLAATGGKLTMLAESGSGTLAGGAHQDTFDEIAGGRAATISEEFQRQFDAEILAAQFPGQPALAYWQLSAKAEVNIDGLVTNVVALSTAGKKAETAWLEEKTGYQLEDEPTPAPGAPNPNRNPNPGEGPGPDGSPAHEAAESPQTEAAEQAQPGGDDDPIDNRDAEMRRLILNGAGNPNHDEKGQFASGPELAAFHDRAIASTDPSHRVMSYRPVDEDEAGRIKTATGLEVSGHVHAVDNYALRHIHKEHGDKEREEPRGQVAVTREDIAALPETIGKADTIEHAGRTKLGRDGIRYTRKTAATTVVVEEVRTKARQLVPVSVVKFKNRATIDAGEPTPISTAEPLRPNQTIIRNSARVNDNSAPGFVAAVGEDLGHVLERLGKILEIQDDAIFSHKLKVFLADFPQLQKDVLADPAAARALQPVIEQAFLEGLKSKPMVANRGGFDESLHPRDESGKFSESDQGPSWKASAHAGDATEKAQGTDLPEDHEAAHEAHRRAESAHAAAAVHARDKGDEENGRLHENQRRHHHSMAIWHGARAQMTGQARAEKTADQREGRQQ